MAMNSNHASHLLNKDTNAEVIKKLVKLLKTDHVPQHSLNCSKKILCVCVFAYIYIIYKNLDAHQESHHVRAADDDE